MTPQLCQLATQWLGRNVPVIAATQVKHNGWRALWLRDNEGRPGLYSRNGFKLHGVEHVEHELAAWERHAGRPMFFDGEICLGSGSDSLARTKAWLETDWKHGGTAGTFHLFDGFAWDQWRRGGCPDPWHERHRRLEALSEAVAGDEAHQWEWRPGSYGQDADSDPVRLVPYRQVFTADCVLNHAIEVWRADGEGVVIKDAASPYLRHRTNDWLKVGWRWRDKIDWWDAA